MRHRVGRALGIALLLAVAAGACATIRVGSYANRATDFASYRTYDWAPTDRLSTGDPRLDNNPFFQERLRSEVDRRLSMRGFTRLSGSPDLVVHYHASVTQQIDVAGVDSAFGYCEGSSCDPFVYEAGSIVLDLVDAGANRLVWRGWAQGSMEGAIDDQDWMERRIDEVVERIMDHFPRNP